VGNYLMAITLDGTNGITTPDVDTDGLTVDTNTLFVDAANNRVGVGTSSPAAKLDITGSDPGVQVAIRGWPMLSVGSPTALEFGGVNSSQWQTLKYYTAGAERARIDASGNLLVGTTSANFSISSQTMSGFGVSSAGFVTIGRNSDYCLALQRNGTDGVAQFFFKGNSQVGTISVTTTNTAYNTSSDYRLKEDVQPMVGATDRLMALKPVNFAWKADGSRVDGFLAHEAQEVVPECVTGEKDAVDDEGNPVYQGIDQSKIVPLLVAALQEALTKIEALEARVAALETNA
jgi:hypothetical protein